MKLFKRILVVTFLIVLVGIIVVVLSFDAIAKVAVEKGASYALGVKTSLNSAKVGLFSGKFRLAGLRVDNPAGFHSDHFLTLSEGGLDLSMRSLAQDTIVVPLLKLKGIDVYLERRGDGKTNYSVLLDHLQRMESAGKPSTKKGTKYVVRQIVIEDVTAHVNLIPVIGKLTATTVHIPEIRLENVGSEDNKGVLLAELTGKLVKEILVAVVQKGTGIIPNDMAKDLNSSLKGLVGQAGKLLEGAGSLFKKE